MAPSFVPDTWLTQTTSFPCFRLNGGETREGIRDEITRIAGAGKSFFYGKLPTYDVVGGASLTQSGFTVVDTNVILELKGGVSHGVPSIIVEEARADQFQSLQDIAASCFRYSRFHLDPLFPKELADAIKRRWVENYCNRSRGSALYAARIDHVPVGFLAALTTGDAGQEAAVIDLLGVAPEYQRRGVGAALVMHFVDAWAGRVGRLRVGTQIANVASLRFYQRCGFEIAESSYVFHGHFIEGAAVS